MHIVDGFPGQRLRVLPRPLADKAGRESITGRILATDVGYFPRAAHHGRIRPGGAAELIVLLCVAGAGRVESGTDTIYAEASDAIVIPPGTPHRYYANEAKPWTIWWVHATGTDASDFGEAICGAGGGPVSIRIDRMLEAAALARAALTAMERDETKASLYDASAATWQLLSMLAARQLRGQHEKVDPIQAAADHIALHYSEPLQVAELAKRASLSVSHFASLFRRDFGAGPREYLCRIRMAHAREDLLTTADSVATVARSVGYDDPFYFSRQFSRIHGVPPSVYRRCQVRRTAVLLTGNRGTK